MIPRYAHVDYGAELEGLECMPYYLPFGFKHTLYYLSLYMYQSPRGSSAKGTSRFGSKPYEL